MWMSCSWKETWWDTKTNWPNQIVFIYFIYLVYQIELLLMRFTSRLYCIEYCVCFNQSFNLSLNWPFSCRLISIRGKWRVRTLCLVLEHGVFFLTQSEEAAVNLPRPAWAKTFDFMFSCFPQDEFWNPQAKLKMRHQHCWCAICDFFNPQMRNFPFEYTFYIECTLLSPT